MEPALRPPAPSFEDHKGLERQGVLEQMAPLGTLPNKKPSLRVKQYDPNRKAKARKSENAANAMDHFKLPERSVNSRGPESQKADERSIRQQSAREKDDDPDYHSLHSTSSSRAVATTRAPVTRNSLAPNSKTAAGQERLRQVVESALERSREIGNEILGLAIRKLFEESLHDKLLADLLDAVLSQRPTPKQTADFQAYIKIARKQLRSEAKSSSARHSVGLSSKSGSKSPSKRTGHSLPSDSTMAHDTSNIFTSLGSQPPETNGTVNEMGASEQDQPPAKRIKRSGSMSSTSSLSSTHSLELETDGIDMIDEPVPTPAGPKGRGSSGPKLHTFSTKQVAGNKRSAAQAAATVQPKEDPSIAELAAKKRRLHREHFEDYHVDLSSVRDPPKPTKREPPPNLTFPSLPMGGRANRADENDDMRSPASSVQGEFLVPPPPGALRASRSRGVTPNALGRSRNTVRKAARIKMS